MSRKGFPSELAERFQIRLPVGVRDHIRSLADANGTSMNTAIVRILETHLSADQSLPSLVERLETAIKALEARAGN